MLFNLCGNTGLSIQLSLPAKNMTTQQREDVRILNIASKIKELRKAKGYSSAEIFAYEYSFNRVSYWRIENGYNITLRTLLRVLDIHGVSLSDFFSTIDAPKDFYYSEE